MINSALRPVEVEGEAGFPDIGRHLAPEREALPRNAGVGVVIARVDAGSLHIARRVQVNQQPFEGDAVVSHEAMADAIEGDLTEVGVVLGAERVAEAVWISEV